VAQGSKPGATLFKGLCKARIIPKFIENTLRNFRQTLEGMTDEDPMMAGPECSNHAIRKFTKIGKSTHLEVVG